MAGSFRRSRIESVLWHVSEEVVAVRLHGGEVFMYPMRRPPGNETSRLDQVYYPWNGPHVMLHTDKGDWVTVELPRRRNLSPRRNRPVVYLDQNHWSSLFKARTSTGRMPAREREAATRLAHLADRRRIILPMSAAHISETGQWLDDPSRYELGLDIANLSSGWQMRHPLGVWGYELTRAMQGSVGLELQDVPPVFTLEPWAMHDRIEVGKPAVDHDLDELPADAHFAYDAILEAMVYCDMLLDADPVEQDSGSGWVERNQRFTDWLADSGLPSERKRMAAQDFVLQDLSRELARAGARAEIDSSAMIQWVTSTRRSDLADLPAVAFFRAIFIARHLDPATVWEGNDVNDMMYLSCAAGYADYLVGERYTTGLLRSAALRLKSPPKFFPSLAEAVPVIEEALAVRRAGGSGGSSY